MDRQQTVERLHQLGVQAGSDGLFQINADLNRCAIDVLSSGVIRINGRDCLDTDYGSRGALRGWTGRDTQIEHAAVLWSHAWAGYYHWMIDIAPKIAVIQTQTDTSGLRWQFPLSRQRYESETLELLGVDMTRVMDTRQFRSISVQQAHMVMLPGWFQIQDSASLLRDRLLPHAGPAAGERIYLKRRGRRRCINEEEVIRHLARKGFVMIEDESRSITDQIGIFRHAKYIVAPHGAALANLLWCGTDSVVIECFGQGYSPPYYRNLAAFTGMRYASVGGCPDSHWTGVSMDIHVDINKLDACMDELGIP